MVVVTPTDSPRQNDIISEAIEEASFPGEFDPQSDLRFMSYDELLTLD